MSQTRPSLECANNSPAASRAQPSTRKQRHCNGLPRGQQTREGEMTMRNLPRRSTRTARIERVNEESHHGS